MNKEYKAAIDRAVWNVLPSEINISNATVDRIHRKILAAVWDYLYENPIQYDAALQSQLQEEKQLATYDLEKEIKKSVDAWYRKSEVNVRGDLGNRMFNIAKAYAASLQESEITTKPKETFTARDAKAAVCRARTCEGFIQNILEDIKYTAECGITERRIITYIGDYKHCYLTKLYKELSKLQFDYEETHKAVGNRIRVQTVISW